jgi:aryl-alcohol dehydrogenase-like predicted oxidoreductase
MPFTHVAQYQGRIVADNILGRRVVELGVNFIDTADSYGPEVSERLIAEALYPYPADLVIATKGGRRTAGRSTCAKRVRAACGGCGWSGSRSTSCAGPIPGCPWRSHWARSCS